jgi:hypothetical protein
MRMGDERLPKRIFVSNAESTTVKNNEGQTRKTGRPRKRWKEDPLTTADMDFAKAATATQNREEWKRLIHFGANVLRTRP